MHTYASAWTPPHHTHPYAKYLFWRTPWCVRNVWMASMLLSSPSPAVFSRYFSVFPGFCSIVYCKFYRVPAAMWCCSLVFEACYFHFLVQILSLILFCPVDLIPDPDSLGASHNKTAHCEDFMKLGDTNLHMNNEHVWFSQGVHIILLPVWQKSKMAANL